MSPFGQISRADGFEPGHQQPVVGAREIIREDFVESSSGCRGEHGR